MINIWILKRVWKNIGKYQGISTWRASDNPDKYTSHHVLRLLHNFGSITITINFYPVLSFYKTAPTNLLKQIAEAQACSLLNI